jgi:hypothetical protein
MQYLKVATKDDIDIVLTLAAELFDFSVYSTFTSFDRAEAKEKYELFLQNPKEAIVILLKEDDRVCGVLGLGKSPLLCSKDLMAVELGMWIKPDIKDKRLALRHLLGAGTAWAKTVGCKAILFGKIKGKNAPEQHKVRRIK